jgi:hypothetical protein
MANIKAAASIPDLKERKKNARELPGCLPRLWAKARAVGLRRIFQNACP